VFSFSRSGWLTSHQRLALVADFSIGRKVDLDEIFRRSMRAVFTVALHFDSRGSALAHPPLRATKYNPRGESGKTPIPKSFPAGKLRRMIWSKTWTVIFRCYACGRKFTIRHITFDRVWALHAVYPCPFCYAKPAVFPLPSSAIKAHTLIELNADTETVYRKASSGDTWHFAPDCSQWPNESFVLLEAEPKAGHVCNECRVKRFAGGD
jgi:hypothetical protein